MKKLLSAFLLLVSVSFGDPTGFPVSGSYQDGSGNNWTYSVSIAFVGFTQNDTKARYQVTQSATKNGGAENVFLRFVDSGIGGYYGNNSNDPGPFVEIPVGTQVTSNVWIWPSTRVTGTDRTWTAHDPANMVQNKVRVDITNPANVPVIFRGVHPTDGQLFQITLQPGENFVGHYNVSTSEPVDIQFAVPGFQNDGHVWSRDPDQLPQDLGFQPVRDELGNPVIVNPEALPPTEEPTGQTITTVQAPNQTTTKNIRNTTIWETKPASAENPQTGVGEKTFREGIGKLEAAVGKLEAQGMDAKPLLEAIKTNTSNTKTAVDGVKGSVDGLGEKLDALKSIAETEQGVRLAAEQDRQNALQTLAATSASHVEAAESAVNSRALRPMGSDDNNPGTGGNFWIVTWPGVAEFNLDPLSNPTVGSLAAWIKAAIAWLIFVLFEWWLWTQLKDIYGTLSGVTPAKANMAPGGVGMPAALLVAIAITAVMVSLPGLFWALADSGVTFPSLAAHPGDTVSGAPEAAVYLLKVFVPTGTLLAVIVQMFIVRKGMIALLAGVSTAIRFIVG